MKKIISLCMLLAAGLVFMSCASKPTGDVRDTSAFKQNKDLGLPNWAGMQFKSGWNKNGYYWQGPVDESGYFASGEAKYSDVKTSTSAADLMEKLRLLFILNRKSMRLHSRKLMQQEAAEKQRLSWKNSSRQLLL